MKIEYFFFIVYILMAIWMLPRIPFIKHAGLSSLQVRLLFCFKILIGLLCALYFAKISGDKDYLNYNAEGRVQYELLLSKPLLFFTDFTNDISTYGLGGLFEASNSFWAYLRFNLLFKFIGIINLLSGGNFFLNTSIFCSLVFFGHIAFYRVYSDIYKNHKLKVIFVCFLLPSLLLYTSCIHKDGIIFLAVGFSSYIFYQILLSPKTFHTKYVLLLLPAMLAIFIFRNYIIMAIAPAMMVTLFCKFFHYPKRIIFLTAYLFFFLLFFASGFSKSSLNLPAAVVQRKADFAALGRANTNIAMNELYPTVKSFIVNLPQAVNHFLFRPYLWEFSQTGVLLTALELFCYQLIFIAFILFRKKQLVGINLFNGFGFAFFISMMLIIGYTIPNIGAIVRYRSIFWIFLLCPLLCNIDWAKLNVVRKK